MDLLEDIKQCGHPSFCIIAPTKYLADYATQSASHLVLAHLVATDSEYANFYAERSFSGDFIMMDNGAFELGESYAPDMLLELAAKCGAHAIVLPDYPFQPAQVTIDAAIKYAPIFKEAGYYTFFVPQSETGDLDGWLEAYEWGSNSDLVDIIGMSILGIPNAIPYVHKAYARVVMAQIILEREILSDKYHHFLGLNAGPALELPTLIDMGILNSCDSSGPVWAGIHGSMYSHNTDSYLISKKIESPVDFDQEYTNSDNVHDIIQHNIDMTLSLFI